MDKKELERLIATAKLGASPIKAEDYTSPLEEDVMKVRGAKEVPEQVTKIRGMTDKIDTKEIAPVISGEDFSDKISKLRALRSAGRKVAGVIPLAGAGMAALSGDPAMAAEELAEDAMGPAAQALRSEEAGMPVEEEMQMLAEDKARKAYGKSPARMARLRALMGGNNE